MRIDIVAGTRFFDNAFMEATGGAYVPNGTTGSDLIEAAGRLCYLSWSRPNPKTATVWGYIKNILRQRHFSVMEHANATLLFQGVTRSFTHQLIRHRHFSVSEVSQRFVDVEKMEMVTHPLLKRVRGSSLDMDEAQYDAWQVGRGVYMEIVEKLKSWGIGNKQAREAARTVLTDQIETKIIVTGNYRTWRHFINMRGSEHADAEIREAALEVARLLEAYDPPAFQDLIYYQVDGVDCVKTGSRDSD